MSQSSHRLSLDSIQQATQIIDPTFLNTPQYECEPLSQALGVRVLIKVETLNPIRSFKGRGADLLVAQADPAAPLMCASAGNFGQAMAYACRKRGVPLTVYASIHANPLKLERMRSLQATVILAGQDFDEAKRLAKQAAQAQRIRFVEDSLDIETLAGAGTMGLEWLSLSDPLDSLAIPLGNGAMFNGVARVLKAHSPQTKMIAVQAAGAPAMIESWRSGQVVVHDRIETIADGIGVRVPVPQALTDMQDLVDEALLVSETAILDAMKLLHRLAGIVTEPSGAVGVAAILEYPARFQSDQRVGTIICGGNLTLQQMQAWL